MAAPPPIQMQTNTTWKILIIDDDEDDYLIARTMLKEARGRKFNIEWANTYAAGKEKLYSDHYHAVLVDYDLGLHSGIDLIREAHERGYTSPLILFTGRGNYEVDVEAMAAGATMYLTKGEVNPLLLERAIRYAIEIKQRENELREAREATERELVERKRAEEELRKSEATLRESEATLREREVVLRRIDARWNAAIESINIGVIIATEDEQVIYWNPAAQKMHGFTRPDEGIEPLEETPITFQLWIPDGSHLLTLDEWPMRRIKRGEPVRDLELCIRRPDQGWEKFFSYSGVMVDTTGGERLIFLTCQDLTEKRQIEDALRESEARQRLALSAAHMVAWDYDPLTHKVRLSDNAEQVLELPRRHENSDQGYNLIHPDDVEHHRQLVTQAIATGGSYLSIYRQPHPDKVIWLEEHGQAVVDAAGRTVRLVGVVQNITERKEAEAALQANAMAVQESQARLIEFVENIRANYFSLDRDWRITYVNNHFSAVLGIDRSDMLGKNFWEVFPQYLGTDVEPRYRKVMAERVPLHFRRGGIYSKSLYDISLYPTAEGLASFSIDRTDEMRYQQQLEEERARWRGVVEAIADEVWLCDMQGRMSLMNLPDRTAMGLEEFKEWPYEKVFEQLEVLTRDGLPLPSDQAPLLRALRGEIVRGEEILRNRKTGKTRYRQYSAAPTRDENGQINGSVAIAHDITQLKQTEAALRTSEEKFASAFRASPVAIAISTVKDGRFIEVNDSYMDLFGFRREELIGHTSIELGMFPDPEERKEVVRRFKENNGFRNYELRLLTKTGEPKDVLFSTEGIDLEGQECMLSLVVDITERKRAEGALQAALATAEHSRILLDALMEYIPEGISITGGPPDFRLERVSRYGRELSRNPANVHLIGKRAGEHQEAWGIYLTDGQTRPAKEQMPLYRASHSGEVVHNEEMLIVRDDGVRIPVLVNAAPIRDNQGHIQGAINCWRDITERKQAEKALAETAEQLARSNRELEEFAFVASHDLKEPLRKVIMFGDSLRRHLCDTPDEARETAENYLTRMQEAAGRMQTMIDGLLDLSRVNTQGREFTLLNLNQVMGEVIDDLEARIQAVSGQVRVDPLPQVMGDEFQIHRLFQNLIVNALKFHKTDVPPNVRVSGFVDLALGGPAAEIHVEDNGIGFEQEYAGQIFQPFQRLHGKGEYEGTGLGLAICQKIVERHHGAILVKSAPGKGSTFIIRLPIQ